MAINKVEQQAWLDQVCEEVIDPDRLIVDPHHHLWRGVEEDSLPPYLLEDLWSDTGSGHHVTKTVFVECAAEYRVDGPSHLRSVGETEFVAALAEASQGHGRAAIAAIVAYADLTQDVSLIREVLGAHAEAGRGLLRGIRCAGACDPDGSVGWLNATPLPDLYSRDDFRRGVSLLGELGYTYDTWHYHFQNRDFAELARSAPDTVMILDHFGTPVGVGMFADRRGEVFDQWKKDIAEIASCANVVAKIGGLAMPPNGFGWDSRDMPASSDELVAAQRDYYLHTIDCFGPDRCMFESNFPVDKMSLSYNVYWNAMKKIAAEFSQAEQDQLFRATATRVYSL